MLKAAIDLVLVDLFTVNAWPSILEKDHSAREALLNAAIDLGYTDLVTRLKEDVPEYAKTLGGIVCPFLHLLCFTDAFLLILK